MKKFFSSNFGNLLYSKGVRKLFGHCRGTRTAQKKKFSIKDFFSEYDQIHRKLRIWSYLLKKSLMEIFIFSAV